MCQIINVACSGDSRVESKEDGKVDKYRDMAMKIKALKIVLFQLSLGIR